MLQNVLLLRWCSEIGIAAHWNLLYGFPGEDPAEYDAMARLIPALTHLPAPRFCAPLRLDRFSPYFNAPEAFGLHNVRPHQVYQYLYPQLSREQLGNIAYYCDYDYGDGRDLAYTLEVQQLVAAWQRPGNGGRLTMRPCEDGILVHDTRPVSNRPYRLLRGAYHDVVVACERPCSKQRILALGPAAESALETLVEMRVVIRDDDSYLNVGVPLRVSSGLSPGRKDVAVFG